MKSKMKNLFGHILSRTKAKKLCYLSAMLGYKYTSDWIINNIPEAAYLIGDYLKRKPEAKDAMMEEYFKNSDYIYDKAEKKLEQLKFLDENGFEPKELEMMGGK